MFKTSKINETYYAQDNGPNFYQFGNYQFYDEYGRQYMIAVKNNTILKNPKFNQKVSTPSSNNIKKCVVTTNGYIKMYCKLNNKDSKWFTRNDINKNIRLIDRLSSKNFIDIKLRAYFKHNLKRRTGIIFVSGFNKTLCNQFLNKLF